MKAMFQDRPVAYPKNCPDGSVIKPLTQALLERRATSHFKPDPVPEKYLEAILKFAAQAPSGYNLQPWRFIVVRDKANRARLRQAAFNQEKISEAPVIIIAFAIKDDWKNYIDAIFDEGVRRGCGQAGAVPAIKKQAAEFLEKGVSPAVWLNRHTMIAVTTMMLVAETYGLDTAPMEGFDPQAVGREFGLPGNAEIVALLAIGYGQQPDKPYGGRLALSETVHDEHFGRPWGGDGTEAGRAPNKTAVQIEPEETESMQPIRSWPLENTPLQNKKTN
jgi:nitroreductase